MIKENVNMNISLKSQTTNVTVNDCKVWITNSDAVPLRFMSCFHLSNTIKFVERNKESNFSGIPASVWLEAFHKERLKREIIVNTILGVFPVLEKDLRDAV